jgi:hypothetical protein
MTAILKVDTIQDTSGNNIINESSDTITIGASGDTISIPSGATIANSGTATGFGIDGITVADQWRLTSDYSLNSSSLQYLSSNLERIDTTGQGTIGSAMTESSGIFTFPSTGIYLVSANYQFVRNGSSQWIQSVISGTTNNSSYASFADQEGSISQVSSSNTSTTTSPSTLVDVTDTSNVKVKFGVAGAQGPISVKGNTSYNYTFFTFIRLGDT